MLAKQRTPGAMQQNQLPMDHHAGACLKDLDSGTRILAGNAGHHALVLNLLVQIHQCSLVEDFQNRLDEPSYEPNDRLLLVRDGQLIGHARVSKQIGWFDQQRCPIAKLQDFAMLPEYHAAEFDASLLEVAESTAAQEGAVLGLVRTERPQWFEKHGWSRCRGQGHTRANTLDILSHFDAQEARPRRLRPSIEVRTWRHFELDSIRHIYQQMCTTMWGALQRSEAAWQWLAGRKAHDQILLAVEKVRKKTKPLSASPPDRNEAHVVGYAVVRDSCIVEMMTLPGYSGARGLMVARACRDAIDRDHHFISLHTPAADPMHELLVTAGGTWVTDHAKCSGQKYSGQWMLKLLAPHRWVERFYPVFHQRAREAGIRRPCELDFRVGDDAYRFSLTRRSSRLESFDVDPPNVHCDWQAFQEMMFSNLTLSQAAAEDRIRITSRDATRTLAALFPPKLFWQSPFEMLKL